MGCGNVFLELQKPVDMFNSLIRF